MWFSQCALDDPTIDPYSWFSMTMSTIGAGPVRVSGRADAGAVIGRASASATNPARRRRGIFIGGARP